METSNHNVTARSVRRCASALGVRSLAIGVLLANPLAACGGSGAAAGDAGAGSQQAGAGGDATSGGGGTESGDAGGETRGGDDAGAAGEGADAGGGNSGTSESDAAAGSDTGATGRCGAGDSNLPPEPTMPAACATLQATQSVAANGVPSESHLDTATIQSALASCATGEAVKLTTGSGGNGAFVTGPITIPTGVSLWVDAGTTLFGTRSASVYGSATALITVKGANSAIVGDGVIDGQGGEPILGGSGSFWDQNPTSGSPALIAVSGATNFTLYGITLHNAPMFHVKLDAQGFVVWGITIKTPSKATNSAGTSLTPTSAHNTDGIDPGEAASNGFIVCSKISDGDDHIAIKGSSSTGVSHLTIAHNHFEAGHGMSIGSEFTGGVSDIKVYDLSIDGTGTGLSGGSSNGLRIKSDSSRGGLVNGVTYSDVCVRGLSNPIDFTPDYSTMTGNSIPQYTNITISDFHALNGQSDQLVTLDGYDASHLNSVTLDNVIVDGIANKQVTAEYTNVTLGPGNVNFMPSGTQVTVNDMISGASTPNACTGKWVTF